MDGTTTTPEAAAGAAPVLPEATLSGQTTPTGMVVEGGAPVNGETTEGGAPAGFVAQPGVPEYVPAAPDNQQGTIPVPDAFRRNADPAVVPVAEGGLLVNGVPADTGTEPSKTVGHGLLNRLTGIFRKGQASLPIEAKTITVPAEGAQTIAGTATESTDSNPTPQAS